MSSGGETEARGNFGSGDFANPDAGRAEQVRRDYGIANTSLPKGVRRWSGLVSRKSDDDSTADKWLRKLVHRHLGTMRRGTLVIEERDQKSRFGGSANESSATETSIGSDINAFIVVEDPATYRAIAVNGVVGAAEAYMDGHWTTPDLVAVIRFFVSNIGELKSMDGERDWSNKLALGLLERFTRNSISGSKKNISAHYDLGNDFFELFLDPTMMYSSALFEADSMTLEQASIAKLDALCQKLQLKPTDHLVEIGTGWGGMALHAARNYGCKVTTTTLSQRQMEHTKKMVEQAGLTDKITVLMKDYRELTGTYDKLVSIEMIEAVGHQYFSEYFAKCSNLLKPHGLMALQAITITDQRYEQARKSVDFIQRYIFPGGCLPSIGVIAEQTARHTDMNVLSVSDMTRDYAITLKHWRESFTENIDRIRALGFDERFIRMWMYYLCYCEGGFRERVIGVYQVLSAKPDYRAPQ